MSREKFMWLAGILRMIIRACVLPWVWGRDKVISRGSLGRKIPFGHDPGVKVIKPLWWRSGTGTFTFRRGRRVDELNRPSGEGETLRSGSEFSVEGKDRSEEKKNYLQLGPTKRRRKKQYYFDCSAFQRLPWIKGERSKTEENGLKIITQKGMGSEGGTK